MGGGYRDDPARKVEVSVRAMEVDNLTNRRALEKNHINQKWRMGVTTISIRRVEVVLFCTLRRDYPTRGLEYPKQGGRLP